MDSIAAEAGSGVGKQARRSAQMRRRLCEAALDVLCEVGYEALSTTMIAARAGVSRGAQTHHFATKADMIVGAFEYLLQTWEGARAAAFAARVDRERGERLRQVLASPSGERDLRWSQLLRFPDVKKEEQFQYMTLCLLRGMAVHSSFNRSHGMNETVLDAWIELAKTLIATERPAGAKPATRRKSPGLA